jgi:hypothetical protein
MRDGGVADEAVEDGVGDGWVGDGLGSLNSSLSRFGRAT